MLRILAVDDHPIFRKGLVALVKDAFVDSVVKEAEDGALAIEELQSTDFDVLILDIDMPNKSGLEVLDYIKLNQLKVKAIILTMHNDELFFNEAFNRGAKGFLLKEDSSLEIIDCINRIQQNVPFVSKRLTHFLSNREQFNQQMSQIRQALDALTKSEMNTLKLVAQNKSSKEIAELLFVTEKSVENYRSRICKKLEISGGANSLFKWVVDHKELIN